RKKSPRDASQPGAVRSTVSPATTMPRQLRVATPLCGSAAMAIAPPASAAVCGALELHPAMENGALEAEPSAASHRAVALASPWICQTTSVAPVELVAPLNIRLPADPVKAPIAVVILEVPSAAKDCAISWPSPARTITALSGPA